MKKILIILGIGLFWGLLPQLTHAATLLLDPSTGTFQVGSTFDVSVFLDTKNKSVNALQVSLNFSTDKLQLVSQQTGISVVSVWTSQPRFSNETGNINLQGGIPGGINASRGLIAVLRFRVRGVGQGIVKFLPESKALMHDGLGTDILEQTQNGVYNLILPHPAGPVVASETHPDQSNWYSNSTVIFKWANETNVEGYSYILSDEPVDVPDDISEGVRFAVAYKNVADGRHYFHIKALREGAWGGVTHFAVKVDTTPPADFPIEIIPDAYTTRKRPVLQFTTSDTLSGIDRYELKIIPLNLPNALTSDGKTLFFETQSPYVPPAELELGSYDVIVRAYDAAGNSRDVTQRLDIVPALFRFISDKGLKIKSFLVIPWIWVWVIALIILAALGLLAFRFRRWHYNINERRDAGALPSDVQQKLDELKAYRKKYGQTLIIILALISSVLFGQRAQALQVEISPPLVTTVSRNISNEEIFYIGGRTEVANTNVIIYIQNLQSGETLSEATQADKNGEWFYRHATFLGPGNYLLWVQTKLGGITSPPSPQMQLMVRQTALQFGASRLSYETLYLILMLIFFAVFLALLTYVIFHGTRARRKHKLFLKEVQEAEESVRRGFAVLRRDIAVELALVQKANLDKELSQEEKQKEAQLLKDLEWAEKYIGKEIWDVERAQSTESIES